MLQQETNWKFLSLPKVLPAPIKISLNLTYLHPKPIFLSTNDPTLFSSNFSASSSSPAFTFPPSIRMSFLQPKHRTESLFEAWMAVGFALLTFRPRSLVSVHSFIFAACRRAFAKPINAPGSRAQAARLVPSQGLSLSLFICSGAWRRELVFTSPTTIIKNPKEMHGSGSSL